MGVLFGGVLDEEKDDESMESTFYNDLYVPYLHEDHNTNLTQIRVQPCRQRSMGQFKSEKAEKGWRAKEVQEG
jgi:hypothetical protein